MNMDTQIVNKILGKILSKETQDTYWKLQKIVERN